MAVTVTSATVEWTVVKHDGVTPCCHCVVTCNYTDTSMVNPNDGSHNFSSMSSDCGIRPDRAIVADANKETAAKNAVFTADFLSYLGLTTGTLNALIVRTVSADYPPGS